jgi:ectoine hydroxylase-related dioxygenase (phytanoyl-CoA dioxygenase family)
MQLDQVVTTIDRDGFVIAERHLDEASLKLVRRKHAKYLAVADSRETRMSSSGSDTRVHLNRDFPGLRQLQCDLLLRAVATEVMKVPLALHYFLSRTLHPGASPQALHMDCEPGSPTLLGFIYMLDDFTAENGCTQFVAGSHRSAPASSPTLAIAPAGSLIMYDRSVLHGFTANTTNVDRRSIQGGFNPATD